MLPTTFPPFETGDDTMAAATKSKPKTRTPKAAKVKQPPAGELLAIPLADLEQHPANPDPTPGELQQTIEWLRDRPQEEPGTVRPILPLSSGKYQVLAGKRRVLALEHHGRPTFLARVRHDLKDDSAALAFIATSNAQRHVDTPGRQAAMINAMMESGMSWKEAGQVYGLETKTAVMNKTALLRLPADWLERVNVGELAERTARAVIPYADTPELMALLEVDYSDHRSVELDTADAGRFHPPNPWKTGTAPEHARDVIRSATRPVDCDATRNFELTAEVESELQVVEIPGERNAKERRALNVTRFDELNRDALAKRQRPAASAKDSADSSGLDKRPAAFRNARELLLRLGICRKLATRERLGMPLFCVLSAGATRVDASSLFRLAAHMKSGGKMSANQSPHLVIAAAVRKDGSGAAGAIIQHVTQLMLFPSCWEVFGQTLGERLDQFTGMVVDYLPSVVRLAPIDGEELERIAGSLEVTIDDAWMLARGDKPAEDTIVPRSILAGLFHAFSREQLDVLAKQISGVDLSGIKASEAAAELLERHASGRQKLAVPKELKRKLASP